MSSNSTSFIKMIDNMIEFSEYDDELSDGIKWIDMKCQSTGVSFYDYVFNILYNYDGNHSIKDMFGVNDE